MGTYGTIARSNSVQDVITDIQTLFGDPAGEQIDDNYVLGFVKIQSGIIEARLETLDLSYDTAVVILPSVPANTADLSSYQTTGQPLSEIMVPTTLEWRLPGQDDTFWQEIPRLDKVQDTTTSLVGGTSNLDGIQSYEWRAGIIYITPSDEVCDIRVRFEVLPTYLNYNSANYIPGLRSVLTFGTAVLIRDERGGTDGKTAKRWQDQYDRTMDDFEDRLVKNEQPIGRRMAGRRSGMQGPNFKMPNTLT